MDKTIMVEGKLCTGCRICELVCSVTKQGVYNPGQSYIQVLTNGDLGVYLPALKTDCDLCGRCVEWCPTQALSLKTLNEAAILNMEAGIGRFPIPVMR
ncbi:MAG: 4Fe-4S dicluster domain-containing protein [Chloroflexota bacterium]